MHLGNIKNNNIFLIGMMGSWKSTVGKELSKVIKLEFIDTDDAIEERTNMKVAEIFNKYGEKQFREMESAFFIEKAKKFGHIFSTGGGIVLNKNNRNILQKNGICFFLEATPQTLAKRIHNTSKRPLLAKSNNLEKKINNIWNDRNQFYRECALHTIVTDILTPIQVKTKILKILGITIADN